MIKRFIEKVGVMNFVMLIVVLSIILVAETMFFQGRKLDALFIGFWAPTILGFMIFFNMKR